MSSKKDRSVADIMAKEVKTVTKETTVLDAVKLMASFEIGSVVVIDDNEKIVGVFTERDLLKRVVGLEIYLSTPIEEVMTPKLICVSPSDSVSSLVKIFADAPFRHVPVVDQKNKIVGIVSMRDVFREVI